LKEFVTEGWNCVELSTELPLVYVRGEEKSEKTNVPFLGDPAAVEVDAP
jgi:hypothetical protein